MIICKNISFLVISPECNEGLYMYRSKVTRGVPLSARSINKSMLIGFALDLITIPVSLVYNAGSNSQDVFKIIRQYTDDVKDVSLIINSYLQRSEFIVFDFTRPEDDPLAIRLRFDTPLNLQKEIKVRQKCK